MPLERIKMRFLPRGRVMYASALPQDSEIRAAVANGGRLDLGLHVQIRIDHEVGVGYRVFVPDVNGDNHRSVVAYMRWIDALATAKRLCRADARQSDGVLWPQFEHLLARGMK